MNEIKFTEAVFWILRERRQGCVDYMTHGNVKSMEHYRELMGQSGVHYSRGTGTQEPAR
jgi:hypothetical protein